MTWKEKVGSAAMMLAFILFLPFIIVIGILAELQGDGWIED